MIASEAQTERLVGPPTATGAKHLVDDRASPATDPVAVAQSLLAQARVLFEAAVAALATRCAVHGKLVAARMDEQQFASYEVALACADLLAAETVVAQPAAADTELDSRLALIFASDALGLVLDRLDALYADLELDQAPLDALRSSTELRVLRKTAAVGHVLAQAGKDVAAAGGDVGHVALDASLLTAQEVFRQFASEVVAPRSCEIHRRDLTVPESLLQPMREMGVFGLSVPEQFGGTAPDDGKATSMMIVVTEALSEASLAAAGSLITRPEILTRVLLAGATDEQKSFWLPKIAAGEPLCAIAMTEPDFGSDVANLALKGTRVDDGWQLNGAKTWCTFAGKAGLLMVVVRTDADKAAGHRGLSIVLVEKPSYEGHDFVFAQPGGGRLSGRAIPTIGYRGMHSFDLQFDDFFVPDANVVGGEAGLGKGFYLTMAGVQGGRMQTAARACGVMRAALLAALRYTADRKVFGAPLSEFRLTQVNIARMAARFVACRKLTYAVGRMMEQGSGRMEASLVKLLACRSAEMVTRDALQLHGGMGYAEETPVSRYFVDARVLSIFEGAEETLALKVVARTLIERAVANANETMAAP